MNSRLETLLGKLGLTSHFMTDDMTKEQLAYGNGLMELLKQPLCHPMCLHEQVLTLFLATHKAFLSIEKKRVKEYQKAILEYFEEKYPEIGNEIEKTKDLSEDLMEQIVHAAAEFKSRWS